jgi:hypothetical protein
MVRYVKSSELTPTNNNSRHVTNEHYQTQSPLCLKPYEFNEKVQPNVSLN